MRLIPWPSVKRTSLCLNENTGNQTHCVSSLSDMAKQIHQKSQLYLDMKSSKILPQYIYPSSFPDL